MYINPFLAGVLCTVFAELLLLFGWAIILAMKDDNK